MANDDSIVKFSEADVKSLTKEQENVNKKKKTSYDLILFKEVLLVGLTFWRIKSVVTLN